MEKWHDPQTITLWLIIVIVVLSLLVFAVIRITWQGFKRMLEAERNRSEMQLEHQRRLAETSVLVQEKERTRIAADLHDALIGKLITIQLKHQLQRDAGEIDELLQESIQEARRISHDLSPPLIEFKSLTELITGVVDSWNRTINISFFKDVRQDDGLPALVKIQFLRIVQELITNAYKHAEADHIQVQLRHTEKRLALRVSDNGRGFDAKNSSKGLGTYNIELRMQQLGGIYRIRSAEGRGVSAIFVLTGKENGKDTDSNNR